MFTHVTSDNMVFIMGPISEIQKVTDVAECVRDFGYFKLDISCAEHNIFAYLMPTNDTPLDSIQQIIDDAIHTVTTEDF